MSTAMNDFVMKKEKEQYQSALNLSTDYTTIIESSELPMTTAKEFIKEHHYQTIITTDNSWRDSNTGRIVLFEKQGVGSRKDVI